MGAACNIFATLQKVVIFYPSFGTDTHSDLKSK